MSERDESLVRGQAIGELFQALKSVVADQPRIQELIRLQEGENRQVLLNMSSVLRMVERAADDDFDAPSVAPQADPLGMEGVGSGPPAPQGLPDVGIEEGLNFFDRAFLKSLKISG